MIEKGWISESGRLDDLKKVIDDWRMVWWLKKGRLFERRLENWKKGYMIERRRLDDWYKVGWLKKVGLLKVGWMIEKRL